MEYFGIEFINIVTEIIRKSLCSTAYSIGKEEEAQNDNQELCDLCTCVNTGTS